MSKWISVKDRLPEKRGDYLCYLDNDMTMVCRWSHRWFEPNWTKVTHWMLLPEPPKEEDYGQI